MNCDENGTPYGVVSMNNLQYWVWDILYDGQNLSEEAAWEEFQSENPAPTEEQEQEFWDYLQIDEPTLVAEEDGVKMELSWLGGGPLLFIIESDEQAQVKRCSPCVPGAGDLDSPDPDYGIFCHSLPGHWFDESHPLYREEKGE